MFVQPIPDAAFGACVTDLDLLAIDDDCFAELHVAFLRYGLLVFPGQALSEDDQIKFGRRWGTLEFGGLALANQEKATDGGFSEMLPLDSHRMKTNIGNEAWHTDSTYWPVSSKCALLTAIKVPTEGGQTEFADMRAAYAALPEDKKRQIATLSAYHSTEYSQANDLGHFPERRTGTLYHGEAYLRPLVKMHPETGIPSLFIGRHAFGIPGLSRDESRRLLQELLNFAVSEPTRVYQHQWQVGDTLLWDNRALLHRACAYDYQQPRVLIGTRVAGEITSELAYYPEDPLAEQGRIALAKELACLGHDEALDN
ncbi:MAG: TauD/TfdA family dioxygenase [Pseudomonadales bacterium]|nr:TauD/TfdA family dioxygenase [Pseudomonadales bacterium]